MVLEYFFLIAPFPDRCLLVPFYPIFLIRMWPFAELFYAANIILLYMYFNEYLRKSRFFFFFFVCVCVCVKLFCQNNYPCSRKTKIMASICVIFSIQTCFVVCTGRQPSTDETLIVETAAWPIHFLINMFTVLKRSQFYFLFHKNTPLQSSLMHMYLNKGFRNLGKLNTISDVVLYFMF